MSKKDDICRCIADESATLNIENLKKDDLKSKNSCYSKPIPKYQKKNRSIY
ncbi:MAG: hypothetical protein ACTSRE_02090 [Promethearchaeota archaeon]